MVGFVSFFSLLGGGKDRKTECFRLFTKAGAFYYKITLQGHVSGLFDDSAAFNRSCVALPVCQFDGHDIQRIQT